MKDSERIDGLAVDIEAANGEMRNLEDAILEATKTIADLAVKTAHNTAEILILKDTDIERKALLFSVRTIVLELSNVLLAQHDVAVEQKVRSRVDKLKTLVNPLK